MLIKDELHEPVHTFFKHSDFVKRKAYNFNINLKEKNFN